MNIDLKQGGVYILRDKIKGTLFMKGHKLSIYADRLNIKEASLSRKLRDDSFTYRDLIILAEIANCDLCLIDKDDKNIVVNLSDGK